MSPTLLSTFKELLNLKNIFSVLLISFVYFALSLFILNYKLLFHTFSGEYPLIYKLKIPITLLGGVWTAFSRIDGVILIITSILVGMNILLILKLFRVLRTEKGVTLSFGGSAILAMVTTGCATCGFSIISFFGLFTSLTFIPFGSTILHLLSLSFLLVSFYYSLKTYHDKIVCRI